MSLPHSDARQILSAARQALKQGERNAARRLAADAARLDPQLEEPWLILAALAEPHASIDYLKRALQINPESQRARKGMHWAAQRLRSQATPAPVTPPGTNAAELSGETLPIRIQRLKQTLLEATQPVIPGSQAKVAAPPVQPPPVSRHSPTTWWVSGLVMALVVCLGLLFWMLIPELKTAIADSPSVARPIGALFKPTITPTPTATFTPTST
ncbi:MAG: hypothetical protein AB1453_12645, partial [Chloroflexota bacterium]